METAKLIISNKLRTMLPTGSRRATMAEIKINGVIYLCRLYLNGNSIECSERNDLTYDINIRGFNYFCFNKASKITCWPMQRGEQPLTENGSWKREGRQEIKPGKFILSIIEAFPDAFEAYDETLAWSIYADHVPNNEETPIWPKLISRFCEHVADSLRAVNDDLKYEINDNVPSIYHMDETENSGYLRNSCMRPDSSHGCRHHAEFYEHVPEAKILYNHTNGRLNFRALLWDALNDDTGQPIKFLDRIYGSDAMNMALIEKAKENGWAYRTYSSNDIQFVDTATGDESIIRLRVQLNDEAMEYLYNEGTPYVDTLYYLDTEHNRLYSYRNNTTDQLQDPSGSSIRHSSFIECMECSDRVDEDDSYRNDNDDLFCSHCYHELHTHCYSCRSEMSRNHDNFIVYDNDPYCMDCARQQDLCECSECNEWERLGNGVCIEDTFICVHCVDTTLFACHQCGEYHLQGNENEAYIDGNQVNVCETCFNDMYRICEICDTYHHEDDFATVCIDGDDTEACCGCINNLPKCIVCETLICEIPNEDRHMLNLTPNEPVHVCENCMHNTTAFVKIIADTVLNEANRRLWGYSPYASPETLRHSPSAMIQASICV